MKTPKFSIGDFVESIFVGGRDGIVEEVEWNSDEWLYTMRRDDGSVFTENEGYLRIADSNEKENKMETFYVPEETVIARFGTNSPKLLSFVIIDSDNRIEYLSTDNGSYVRHELLRFNIPLDFDEFLEWLRDNRVDYIPMALPAKTYKVLRPDSTSSGKMISEMTREQIQQYIASNPDFIVIDGLGLDEL